MRHPLTPPLRARGHAPLRLPAWTKARLLLAGLAACIALAAQAPATDGNANAEWDYYNVRLDQLEFEDNERSPVLINQARGWNSWWNRQHAPAVTPTADLEGFLVENGFNNEGVTRWSVRLRLRRGAEPKGTILYRESGDESLDRLAFSFPAGESAQEAEEGVTAENGAARLRESRFWEARAAWFKRKLDAGEVGAPYFRHQEWRSRRQSLIALGKDAEEATRAEQRQGRPTMDDRAFSLFTGGRAIRENLQLDRALVGAEKRQPATVPFAEIKGIETQEMDWSAHLDPNSKAELDALASWIPKDRHAVFFGSFGAMTKLIDEAKSNGSTPLRLLETRSETADTHEFYEHQLALPLSELARKFGPAVVAEVAFTGSDPYLREGTDVAMLFLCKPGMAPLLEEYVKARHGQAAATEGVERVARERSGATISGVSNKTRTVSSFLGRVGDVAIVSNSSALLDLCLDAGAGKTETLSSLDEYKFFRQRYQRGTDAALVVLSDATIRRWAGPQWRIVENRRARSSAALADAVARAVADRDPHAPKLEGGPFDGLDCPLGGEFRMDDDGLPYSTVAGSLRFLVPIIEHDVAMATPAERDGYEAFRRQYQNYWRQFFDPIAIQAIATPEHVSLDTTVAPLIGGSDYNEFIELTKGKGLSHGAAPPSETALLHVAMQLNPEARPMREFSRMASGISPNFGPNGSKWIGDYLQLVVERDEQFWNDYKAAAVDERGRDQFLENNWWRLPIGFEVQNRDTISLTLFLSGVKSLLDMAAPGLVVYETREHAEQAYVCMFPDLEEMRFLEESRPASGEEVGLYYVATKDFWFISLRERLVRERIDRATAAKAADASAPNGWLGDNIALRVDGEALPLILDIFDRELTRALRERCYANIAILNEWKRLGEDDPVAFHEKSWGVKLLCPAGGEFVWDEANQTMKSTVLGSSLQTIETRWNPLPAFGAKRIEAGLTFELDGLRACVEMARDPEAMAAK
jgi:hypothetical protein